MIMNIFSKIGYFLLAILKGIAWVLLTILKLGLESLKIMLLLFGLVARIFLAFVKVGTA